jgi:hypothetical protein
VCNGSKKLRLLFHVKATVDPLPSRARFGMRYNGRGPEFGNSNLVMKLC